VKQFHEQFKTLSKQFDYDIYGRVARETFPTGYYTENHYDDYGNLFKVTDSNATPRTIWQATGANARGQLTNVMKGAKETVYGYDETKGQLTSMTAAGVVNYSYGYDTKNNLEYRSNNLINQKEQFTYDTQNRLTNWDILNNTTNAVLKPNSITYDGNTGNIMAKSDLNDSSIPNDPKVVSLNYEKTTNPHALTTITPATNAISGDELAVAYTDFRKIKTLSEGGKNYAITYGVDDQRRVSVQTQGASTLTKYYFGDYEEEVTSTNVRKIHYLSGAIYIQNNNSDSLLYTYTDNQGSLIALTNESGDTIQTYAYDPWGARRNSHNWTQKESRTSWIINRGYTGHEHLDVFGVINMNGRIYDPHTAMFYSPDPFVQTAGDWKNYNRYSYCMNNPTRYTDPSGYKYYNKESVWFAEFAGNWMNQATSGSSSTLKYWSDHQGSISYNPENKRYEYRSGAEATIDEAMSFLFRGTNHTVLTVTGQEAINAYKRSYLYINGRGHDEAVRNRVLANMEKSANDMIAKIEKSTADEWNNLVAGLASANAIALERNIEELWYSLKSISATEVLESTLHVGIRVTMYMEVLTWRGDTRDKTTYHESRGEPFKEPNRYQNEFRNLDQQPPKGAWWIIGASAAYSIYNNWVKPNLNIQSKPVQPFYQQPNVQYDHYFMNLK